VGNLMKNFRQQALTDRLDHLISRLYELKERDCIVVSGWKDVDRDIEAIYEAFLNTIDIYINHCNLSKEIIQSSDFPSELWNEFIDFLYYTAQFLRIFLLKFFPPPTSHRLYNYIFVKNLLQTFPKNLRFYEDIKFIVIPSDEIALVPISPLLLGRLDVVYESLEKIGNTLLLGGNKSNKTIPKREDDQDDKKNYVAKLEGYAFECDPRETLMRKTVLAHEIFHIVCRKKPEIMKYIDDEIKKGRFNSYIHNIEKIFGDKIDIRSHLIEMFCDFGAAWHLGPCYGIASIEELSFGRKEITETHPPRSIRLRIILEAYKGRVKHPYIEKFKNTVELYKDEIRGIKQQKDIEPIVSLFKTILKEEIEFDKYIPPNLENKIRKHISNKVPYIYKEDIRELLNNVPDTKELTKDEIKHLGEFLFESVRKNAIFMDFNKALDDMGFGTLELYTPTKLEG